MQEIDSIIDELNIKQIQKKSDSLAINHQFFMSKLNHLEFMLNRPPENIFESSKSNKKLNSFNQNMVESEQNFSSDSFTSSSNTESIDKDQINIEGGLKLEVQQQSFRRSQSLNSKRDSSSSVSERKSASQKSVEKEEVADNEEELLLCDSMTLISVSQHFEEDGNENFNHTNLKHQTPKQFSFLEALRQSNAKKQANTLQQSQMASYKLT